MINASIFDKYIPENATKFRIAVLKTKKECIARSKKLKTYTHFHIRQNRNAAGAFIPGWIIVCYKL